MRAQLRAVMTKELRQAFRDRRMAAILLIAPLLQTTLLGFAVNLDVDRIPTQVSDQDQTPYSRELLAGLLADGTFDEVGVTDDPERSIARGDATVVLVVPKGLSARVAAGLASEVQILVDGTEPIPAQTAMNVAEQYFRIQGVLAAREVLMANQRASGALVALPGSVSLLPRIFYNPSLETTVYMVPGVAAVVLLIVTTVTTAMGIAREKELGTIEQIMVTPIRPSTLLLGKTLPFAGVGLVAAGLVLGLGTNVFGVPIRGSIFALFLSLVVYLLSTLGMGVLISTLARNQQQAILGGFFTIMPSILLSGFMSPIRNMPEWIQWITWINPVRHFVEILRAILLKGAGLADIVQPLSILALFGATILTLASMRFRKRLG
ncbi:MAG: ABC transporter permease [Deltaproteobacteria bacterium]|nr:ABC transporter permease [Deltaproteobacteria bacterium]